MLLSLVCIIESFPIVRKKRKKGLELIFRKMIKQIRANYSILMKYLNAYTFFLQDSLVSIASRHHQSNVSNLLLVSRKRSILSKIFSHTSEVFSFKKYDYPKVTESVST